MQINILVSKNRCTHRMFTFEKRFYKFGVLNTYYLDLLIDTEVSYRNQIARQAKLYAHIVASPNFSPPPEQRHRSGRDGPCKVILVLLLCKIVFFSCRTLWASVPSPKNSER